MKKKLCLYIVLALALVFSVSAVGNINIAEATVFMSGNPGAINSTQYFTVHNTGGSALNGIVINSTSLTAIGGTIPATALQFVPNPLDLAAGSNAPVAIVLTIPSGQRAGTYTGTAYAVYNATNQDAVTLSVTVRDVPDYSASAATPSIVQGTSGTMTVNVTNTGNSDIGGMFFRISDPFVSGLNVLDVTSSATGAVSVAYGSSNSFVVSFNPPSSQAVGIYTGDVNFSYGGVNKTFPLSVSIEAINRQLSGSATSAGVTVNRASSLVHSVSAGQLVLNNTGNYPLTGVTIYASDLVGPSTISSSSLSVSENGFTMALGAGKNIYITPAGVSASLASGTYTGSLLISYGGTTNLTVPFSLVVSDATAAISLDTIIYPLSQREENVSTSVTITNNGDFALTGITLAHSAPNTWMTGSVPGSLAVGSSFTVTFTSTVPDSADSGPYKIGTVVFHSNEYSKTVDLKTNVESKLIFDSVKVSIDDGSWDSVNSGDTADDDAKPGSTFAVKVKLENLFDDSTGIDMDDIEVTAVFYEAGEDGDDIEGDTETFDIDAGDKSSEYELEFDDDVIDWDATAGKLLMELTATSEDDNGGRHKAVFNFSINVEREEKAEIVFSRVDAPSTVMCGRSFTLYVEGRSIGEKSDDEIVLKIDSSGLGINVKETFEMGAYDGDEDCNALDRDEEDCVNFDFSRSVQVPSNIASGTYKITAKLYRDNENRQTDEESIDIVVECGTSSSGSTSGSATSGSSSSAASPSATTTAKPAVTAATTPGSTTSSVDVFYGGGQVSQSRGIAASMPTKVTDTTKPKGFTESGGYLALLSVLSIVVIIGIIVLIIYAFTRPAE